MYRFATSQKGFTFIELLIVMAVLSILAGIATVSLFSVQNRFSLDATVNILMTDIWEQQTKAMTGDIQSGSSAENNGIYFDASQNRYILFRGSVYADGSPSNVVVELPENYQFTSVLLPNNSLIFLNPSGETDNYSETQNSITIRNNQDLTEKVLRFNKYGVITEIE